MTVLRIRDVYPGSNNKLEEEKNLCFTKLLIISFLNKYRNIFLLIDKDLKFLPKKMLLSSEEYLI